MAETTTVTLSPIQTRLLREAATNNGLIYVGGWMTPKERKACDGLVAAGMLAPGRSPGSPARHLTKQARRLLADLDGKKG